MSCQLASDRLREVQAQPLLVVAGAVHDAVVVLREPRHEVLRVVVPAAHIEVRLVRQAAVTEDLLLVVAEAVAGGVVREHRGGVHHFLRGARARVRVRLIEREVTRAQRICLRVRPQPLRERKACLPGRSPLRGDDDDAVGRARAVDRGRGRSLQDLDRLDVVGIEVGDAIDAVVLRPGVHAGTRARNRIQSALDDRVGDGYAVHDVERLRVAEDRRDAAHLHLQTAARRSGVRRDVRSGDLPLKRVLDRRRLRSVDCFGTDRRHVIGEVSPRHVSRLPRDHLLAQPEHVGLELDVDLGLVGGHRDRGRSVANAANLERDRAVWSTLIENRPSAFEYAPALVPLT